MKIGTCNIMNNPDLPRPKVRKAARIARAHCGIIGFQEIRELEDAEDVQAGLGMNYKLLNTQTSVPIGVHRKWNVIDQGYTTLHASASYTPMRYASWVIANLEDTPPVAVINLHFINKAWNGKEQDARILGERVSLWERSWQEVKEIVFDFRYEGYPVFVVGDFNRLVVAPFYSSQEWLSNYGIDKIAFIPRRGIKFRTRVEYTVNTPSDHHLRVVGGRLLVP